MARCGALQCCDGDVFSHREHGGCPQISYGNQVEQRQGADSRWNSRWRPVLQQCGTLRSGNQVYFLHCGAWPLGRQLHTATLLQNGKVLITGGGVALSSSTTLNTAEIYDPATGLFTATTGIMNHTPCLPYRNTALMTAGCLLPAELYPGASATATAEIFDPATGVFTATADMTSARTYHAAVLLNDDKVLITGGAVSSTGASLNTAEIFNPAGSGSFSSAGTMNTLHSKHSATLLTNGNVLIAGSSDGFIPLNFQ